MDLFYKSDQQQKTYKLSQNKYGCLIYWVAVYQLDGGGFFHGRGADPVANYQTGKKILDAMARPVEEEQYLNAIKDYFAIDKKVRNQFISRYNL
jgi:hypothetical protein